MSDPSELGAELAVRAHRRLARTINVALDLGAEPERGWSVEVGDRHLDLIEQAGFSAIRLVVCCELHRAGPASDELDPLFLARISQIIVSATERGLAVVVANLRDPALMADPPAHRDRLLGSTRHLACALRAFGPSLMLEPLAEPQQRLDAVWNDYLAELCAVVRAVDPGRTLLVGPRTYNNARFLHELILPARERNLILTIHHYWPITFTMQGETFLGMTELGDPATWLGSTWEGTPAQRAELRAGFDGVAAYARAQERPLFLGEFGTTNHAEMASRVRWTRFNRELAEHHGFAWGCWSFGPSFALYDFARDRWHGDLLRALMGQSAPGGPLAADLGPGGLR